MQATPKNVTSVTIKLNTSQTWINIKEINMKNTHILVTNVTLEPAGKRFLPITKNFTKKQSMSVISVII